MRRPPAIARCIVTVVVVVMLTEAAHGRPSPSKCNCNCPGSQLVCGKEATTQDVETFKNPCQMICQSCTHNQNWVLLTKGACKGPSKRTVPATPTIASTSLVKVEAKTPLKPRILPQDRKGPSEVTPKPKILAVGG